MISYAIRLFVIVSAALTFTLTFALAQDPAQHLNPYHGNPKRLKDKKEVILLPLSESIVSFGSLTVTNNSFKWGSGQQSEYNLVEFTDNKIVIELIKKPLPKFKGKTYKFLKFSLVDMDEVEISLYKSMYIASYCQTKNDLERDDTLWGIYLLK